MTEVPPDRRHTVALEELVGPERHAAYAALMAGAGLEPSAPTKAFLAARVTAEHAAVGRWRRGR
jgi:hypothetical protein